MSKLEDDFRKALGLDTFRDQKQTNRIFRAPTTNYSDETPLKMPNGHLDLSRGVHEIALVGTTREHLNKQMDSVFLRIYDNGGTILNEKRRRLSQGSFYVLITYEMN